VRIAAEVESSIEFKSYQPAGESQVHAIAKVANVLAQKIYPKCIAVFTTSGLTALSLAAERLRAPVVALTTDPRTYHALNLVLGIRPLMIQQKPETVESLVDFAVSTLEGRGLLSTGDTVLVLGSIPGGEVRGANFIKVHTLPRG